MTQEPESYNRKFMLFTQFPEEFKIDPEPPIPPQKPHSDNEKFELLTQLPEDPKIKPEPPQKLQNERIRLQIEEIMKFEVCVSVTMENMGHSVCRRLYLNGKGEIGSKIVDFLEEEKYNFICSQIKRDKDKRVQDDDEILERMLGEDSDVTESASEDDEETGELSLLEGLEEGDSQPEDYGDAQPREEYFCDTQPEYYSAEEPEYLFRERKS